MNRHLKNIIAILITVAFTVAVFYNIDINTVKNAFEGFDIAYLWGLIPFFFFLMIFRVWRWALLLPKTECSPFDFYGIYMTSNLINVFLPARAGDVFRGCYFGKRYGISRLKAFGTVAAERITDGLTVVGILLLAIALHGRSAFTTKLVITAAIIFAVSFLVMLWIYKYDKITQICEALKKYSVFLPKKFHTAFVKTTDGLLPYAIKFVSGFEAFADGKILLKIAFMCVLAWACDCLFIDWLLKGFGINVDFTASLFAVSFIALSTIIPSSSIYIGLYQYAFILALGLFGIDKSVSLAVAVSQQFIMLLAYTVTTIIFILKNHVKLSDINSHEVTEE